MIDPFQAGSKGKEPLGIPLPSTGQWLAIVAIAVLAPFLGGSTTRATEGVILVLLGLLLLAWPPRHSLGGRVDLLFSAFFCLGMVSFLPAAWFGIPAWRHQAESVGLVLPSTLTPQPWITAEALALLLAGMAWLYLLCEAQVRSPARALPIKAFVFGTALLSATSIYLYSASIPWPFPHNYGVFGPFLNKNQTGDLLAIASLAAVACVYDAGPLRWRVLPWVAFMALDLAGLALADSRGAIVLFLLGLILWFTSVASVTRSKSPAVAGGAILSILLTLFVIFGGAALNRFHVKTAGGEDISGDLRWVIHRDALAMSLASPWAGAGLGNFRSVFPLFHRALGSRDYELVHPESDWLWIVDEMGWPAAGLVVIGAAVLLLKSLPLPKEKESCSWRALGLAAAVIFLLHGFVDVAGHRLGSALPALFVMSFAIPVGVPGPGRRLIAWLFRLGGLLMLLVGANWIHGQFSSRPGSAGAARIKALLPSLNNQAKYEEGRDLASTALQWAPMDWQLYYERAVSEACLGGSGLVLAWNDFLRARFLQPTDPGLPYNEGLVWIDTWPAAVDQAWQEALRRSAPGEKPALFQKMVAAQTNHPWLIGTLRKLAGDDTALRIIYLQAAPADEVIAAMHDFLLSDPDLQKLSPDQKETLMNLWSRAEDASTVATAILSHSQWLPAAWPIVVKYLVSLGDYHGAYELSRRFARTVEVPPPFDTVEPPTELLEEIYTDPADFVAGASLVDHYLATGQREDALLLIQKLTALPGCPAFLFAREAELYAARGKWKEAFDLFQHAWDPISQAAFQAAGQGGPL